MLCPVCLTAALVANAPAIAASIGGVAAVKVCLNQAGRNGAKAAPTERQQRQQQRVILDPAKIMRYDEQEW
ncbi:hypothetical protein HXX76_001451 [Chlamydomonas incerta]|uniref:Secreted protein n=1 Tax=Chlamydomonas incerta TaxID=51695 RepID=A0A835WC70_CHLIN|nr:hypothetical protein HXX76_001451 [Chlamydomonas incerta]|eukprot:KAG2444707.1 hypothetical protein HXX76_001451 [Chlamydomonas incerta]